MGGVDRITRAGTSGQVEDFFREMDLYKGGDRKRIQKVFDRNPNRFAQLLLLRGLAEGCFAKLPRKSDRQQLLKAAEKEEESMIAEAGEKGSYEFDLWSFLSTTAFSVRGKKHGLKSVKKA